MNTHGKEVTVVIIYCLFPVFIGRRFEGDVSLNRCLNDGPRGFAAEEDDDSPPPPPRIQMSNAGILKHSMESSYYSGGNYNRIGDRGRLAGPILGRR